MGCGTFIVGNSHYGDSDPWNKIYQILLSRNYVYMFVDLKKRLFVKRIKNTAINIAYSLSLSNDSVTHMSTPLSPTLYNDKPMSLSMV